MQNIELTSIAVHPSTVTSRYDAGWDTCPLTGQEFKDPVVLSDGLTYERDAVVEYFQRQPGRSPAIGGPLADTIMVPNHVLRKALQSRRENPMGGGLV